MSKKRKILLVGIAVLIVFSLLFLSGGGKKPKELTLTVSVLSGVHKDPFLKVAPLFEKDHPGVNINIVEYPFSDIYEKEMLEATSHSGAIDIYEQLADQAIKAKRRCRVDEIISKAGNILFAELATL